MDVLTSVDPTSSQPASSDPFHPSFFELAAQSQLQELIKPALRYVLAVLAQRNPRHLLRVVNSFDELYALLMVAIETHYLRIWGSSFAENFYGLRRRRRPGLVAGSSVTQAKTERLRRSEIRASLVFLVAMPYLGAKLDDVWERNGGGLSNTSALFGEDTPRFSDASRSWREKMQSAAIETLKTTYPYAKTLYQLWLLTYNVGYLFGKTPYWRPWLQLMRVDVRRVGPNDGPRKPLLPRKMPSLVRQPGQFLALLSRLAAGGAIEALKYALPASIFFFKFLEWWFGADNPRRRRNQPGSTTQHAQSTSLDPPQPLQPDWKTGILSTKPDAQYKLPPIYTLTADLLEQANQATPAQPTLVTGRNLVHNSCPLCGTLPINNPAVLPTGYVFCYTCAFEYLDRYAKCPVTNVPVVEGKEALRKVLG